MSIKIQRQKEKELKEIQKLERELARPRGNTYLWYRVYLKIANSIAICY